MDVLPVVILLNILFFAVFIPLAGLLNRNLCRPLAVLGVGISAVLSIYGFVHLVGADPIRYYFGGWKPPIGIEFVYDGLSSFFVAVINSVSFFVLLHSGEISKNEFPEKHLGYFTVAMLMLLGFNGMVMTGDLFNLFVFLEISSLSTYALIAIGEEEAPFAAFRYLILGTMGGTLFLLGVGFLYSVTGTLNIQDMAGMLPKVIGNNAVVSALVLMVVGLGIKAAMFPLHGWLPDAYTYTNSTSSALIAPIGTKVGAYVMIRIVLYLFGVDLVAEVGPFLFLLGLFACGGILYGSFMAIAQSELKRMLAFSSISQIGYIILGLSLANLYGFIGAVFHVLNHALMKGCLFMVSGNLRLREGHTDMERFDETYRKKYPWTMLSFSIAAISMVGLPPLAGFFSKWYLALGTIQAGNWLFLSVILLSSLLNAVYFFRIFEKIYAGHGTAGTGEGSEEPTHREIGYSMLIPTSVFAVSLLVVGLANVPIVNAITSMFP